MFRFVFFYENQENPCDSIKKIVSRNIIAMFLKCSVVIIFFAINIQIAFGNNEGAKQKRIQTYMFCPL